MFSKPFPKDSLLAEMGKEKENLRGGRRILRGELAFGVGTCVELKKILSIQEREVFNKL